MKSYFDFSPNEIQGFVNSWTNKECDILSKGDSASQFEKGVAQAYHDAAGDLLERLENKRKKAQIAKLEIEQDLNVKQMKVQAIVTMFLAPLALLVMAIIMPNNIRLLTPFILAMWIIILAMKRWAINLDILWLSILVCSGLGFFVLINWGDHIWLRLKSDIAPELAGAGLIGFLFSLYKKSAEDKEENILRIVMTCGIVLLGTTFAADIPGLSLWEKTKVFMSNLSIETIGAGVAILTFMDETPDEGEILRPYNLD